MIRTDSFGRSALLAGLIAALWLPWMVALGPLLGPWRAHALYLAGAAAACIAGIAPGTAGGRPPRRLVIALIAGSAAVGLALLARTTTELAIGLAVLLGLARSGVFYRVAAARAVAVESALLIGGLLFARQLAGPAPLSTAVALWGFLLVQSLYFLIPGRRLRGEPAAQTDPFEAAHRRAIALLEHGGL